MTTTWILVAGEPRISNLVAIAREFGGDVTAAVVGPLQVAEQVAHSGVDKVIWFGAPAPAEAMAQAVAAAVKEARPRLILGASRDGERVLLGAVAATLAAPVLTMASNPRAEGGTISVRQAIFGGIAEHTLAVDGPVVLVADGGAIAEGGDAPIVEFAAAPAPSLRVEETTSADHAQVDLGKAKRIVAVGRGLKSRDDLAIVESLAQALEAEVACSRPIAEGLGWLPADRYVGVTGQHVAPELYVAVGISGQLQHLVGARGAGTIVVVNSDPKAPFFAEADYGIVGDLYQVLPALVEALGRAR